MNEEQYISAEMWGKPWGMFPMNDELVQTEGKLAEDAAVFTQGQ